MPVTIYQMQNGQLVQLDLGGAAVTVDSALSSTSTNPVQNRAIYAALEDKADSADIPEVPDLTRINITLEEPTGGSSVTRQIDLTQDFILYLPDDYASIGHTHDSSDIVTLNYYSKPATTSAIAITDTLNEALGKLEKALDGKANTASPALSGTPTAPTAAAGTNTTQIATTAFVTTAIAAIPGAQPYSMAGTVSGYTVSNFDQTPSTANLAIGGVYFSIEGVA